MTLTTRLDEVTDEQREKTYRCHVCNFECKVDDMDCGCDCDDMYDAVCSDFCCLNCYTFYSFLENWIEV